METIKIKDAVFLQALMAAKQQYMKQYGYTDRVHQGWWLKVIALLVCTLFFYSVSYFATSVFWYFISMTAYALSVASLVLNIIHDTTHDAVFKNKKANNYLRHFGFLWLGISSHVWWQEHKYGHHPVANVIGADQGIIETSAFRFHEGQTLRWYHKWQHWYAPVLYCLHMTDYYLYSEFGRLRELLKTGYDAKSLIGVFIVNKVSHLLLLLVLPLLFSPFSWGIIIGAFLWVQVIHSWILIYCLGTTHLNEAVVFYPDKNAATAKGWVRWQMETTIDYGVRNPLLTAYLGGFNLHVLHHILPNVAHVHLAALMPDFMQLTRQYGYEYKEMRFFDLLTSHFRLLKQLGGE